MSKDRMTAEQIRAAETREGVSAVDHMSEMLSAIHAPALMEDGWRDISNAPYDGTLIRVRDRGWSPCHAQYIGTRFVDGHWKFTEYTSFTPTHWQPLPEPPSTLTDLERAGAGNGMNNFGRQGE